MSAYQVLKLCRRLGQDEAFRSRLLANPESALGELRLTSEERQALLSGNVRWLHDHGAHGFLLSRLPRYGAFGITQERYVRSMKGDPAGSQSTSPPPRPRW